MQSKYPRSAVSFRPGLPVLAVLAVFALSVGAAQAESRPERIAKKASAPVAWCASEFEALPGEVCHIDGGKREGRRTLVIFLHGAIAKDVTWQWMQERALARQAKQSGFTALFPKAPLTAGGHVWPGTTSAQEASEQQLIDGWMAAKKTLEARDGKFDDVFLMGFSSGAYFVSSLALRGRTKVDGYGVFAGGAAGQAAQGAVPAKPVFVGVCADDAQTASHSRAFGGAVAARGWPHRIDEQHVGHMFGDVHVAHAVAFLRSANKSKPAE